MGKEASDGEIDALIGLLKDRREKVRVFAAHYLIELGKPAGHEAIVQAVITGRLPNCPELSFILTVIACESPGLIVSLLMHADKGVQLNALTALVESGRRESARHLVPLLSSADSDLRAFAAEGLGRLRFGEAQNRYFGNVQAEMILKHKSGIAAIRMRRGLKKRWFDAGV